METNMQEKELLQQIDYQRYVNDQLLHKYVKKCMQSYWEVGGYIALFLLVLAGGILANQFIKIEWPVIIVFWLVMVFYFICKTYYAYPISPGQLNVTNSAILQQTLLSYKKHDLICNAVFLPVLLGVTIWFAFEGRSALTQKVFPIEYDNTDGQVFFWAVLLYSLLFFILVIVHNNNKYQTIDKLVEEIGQLRI